MENKKKILLLTTGGTIASLAGSDGLQPHRSDVMEREIRQLGTYYDITVKDVMCLDSSNIRPGEWQLIAEHIFHDRAGFDGIKMQDTSGPVMQNVQQVYAGLTYGKGTLNETYLNVQDYNRGFQA